MEIGVALTLAVAAAGGQMQPIADHAKAGHRHARPVSAWAYNPPAHLPDVDRYADLARQTWLITRRELLPRFAVTADSVDADREPRLEPLVTADREAAVTGRRVRRSSMAAGLSLKVTQADGVLAPEVGMSGPVGKALTRIALEAVEPR